MYPKSFRAIVFVFIGCLLLSSIVHSQQNKNYRSFATANYQIMYERRLKLEEVRLLAKALESEYTIYHKKFNLSYPRKVKVFILTSSQRLRNESESLVYGDAANLDDRIYISFPDIRGKNVQGGIPRIVAHSLLSRIVACPAWLLEAYAIHAGGDYKRFGKPVETAVSNFSDLGEEFARSAGGSGAREVYALLASTAKFFAERYTEEKFESIFLQLKRGNSVEQAFESSFGEKMTEIEHAWASYVRSQVKE